MGAEVAFPAVLNRPVGRDRAEGERVAQVAVDVVDKVGLDVAADLHRGVATGQLEGAGLVAAGDHVGRRHCRRQQRHLLLLLVDLRLLGLELLVLLLHDFLLRSLLLLELIELLHELLHLTLELLDPALVACRLTRLGCIRVAADHQRDRPH